MKWTTWLFALFFLGGCLSGTPAATQSVPLTQTQWNVVEISGYDGALTHRAYLRLRDANGSRASGFAGCNRFGGTYTKTADRLSFGPLMATRMYCPAMPEENALFNALKQVERFSITGNSLVLSAQGKSLLKLQAASPTP
jgi:heat shock protein HslJ